jgi:hypothetical protein
MKSAVGEAQRQPWEPLIRRNKVLVQISDKILSENSNKRIREQVRHENKQNHYPIGEHIATTPSTKEHPWTNKENTSTISTEFSSTESRKIQELEYKFEQLQKKVETDFKKFDETTLLQKKMGDEIQILSATVEGIEKLG